MSEFHWESVGSYVNPVLNYLQHGFNEVNAIQGLAIALIIVILMKSWKQWLSLSFSAAVLHAVLDAIVPIVKNPNAAHMPPIMTPSYWQYLAALFVGYLIIIAVFFSVKKALLPHTVAASKK